MKSGHPACPFITHKQLALYANPRFWQYGLLAFIARCCSFDNQHRHQGPGTAQVEEGKSQTTKKKMSMPLHLCALSSCPLLGEWSVGNRHYPPMTSLSICQYNPASGRTKRSLVGSVCSPCSIPLTKDMMTVRIKVRASTSFSFVVCS